MSSAFQRARPRTVDLFAAQVNRTRFNNYRDRFDRLTVAGSDAMRGNCPDGLTDQPCSRFVESLSDWTIVAVSRSSCSSSVNRRPAVSASVFFAQSILAKRASWEVKPEVAGDAGAFSVDKAPPCGGGFVTFALSPPKSEPFGRCAGAVCLFRRAINTSLVRADRKDLRASLESADCLLRRAPRASL